MTYEIQHLRGQRIVSSWVVEADSHNDAIRKSEAERKRRHVLRYRIAAVRSESRQKHGGFHGTSIRGFDYKVR
jgi:hypothetical protein